MQHGYSGFTVKCNTRPYNGIVAVAVFSLYHEILDSVENYFYAN